MPRAALRAAEMVNDFSLSLPMKDHMQEIFVSLCDMFVSDKRDSQVEQ